MNKMFKKGFSLLGIMIIFLVTLVQCTSSNNKEEKVDVEQTVSSEVDNTNDNTSKELPMTSEDISKSYINLYDGRSAFPDSVHKSWQNGTLDEARNGVLSYIDEMISGTEKEIQAYRNENKEDEAKVSEGKLERIKNLKQNILSAQTKDDLKHYMHSEFKSGKYEDIYGTSK